jgi:hypothetical protein
MLSFVAEVGVFPNSEEAYASIVKYTVSRVAERPDGDPAAVRIRPDFRGAAEALYPSFKNAYPNMAYPLGTALDKEHPSYGGQISFNVSGSTTNWQLASATYQFVDNDDRMVAAMEVPVFVPAR